MGKTVIILILVGLGTCPSWAKDTAPCPKTRPVEVHLVAGEFKIPAYDARRELMAVRPTTELLPGPVREYAVRLVLARPEVLMPIGPHGFSLGLETGHADLELVVEGEPLAPAVPPAANPDCGALTVRSMRLERRGVVLSRRVLSQPVEQPVEMKVYSRLHVEKGAANALPLETVGIAIAEKCLSRALSQTRTIQGALSIQLSRTLLGQAEEPKIVVDGLVNRFLSYCLVAAFRDSDRIWSHLEPASRVYLTLYLRGASGKDDTPAKDGPAALRSGE